MSNIHHLHQETKILPVKPHNEMLSKQYLLRCHIPSNPCNYIIREDPPPRNIKKNLNNTYLRDLQQQYPASLNLDNDTYRMTLQQIHSDTINTTTERYTPNRVLGINPPPEISEEEKQLSRSTRVTLAQLRSGWCNRLQSYKSRIDPTVDDKCPTCNTAEHTVQHLFQCPAKPTTLTPESLWTNPVGVAAFMELESE
uniref:Uncharacterized protein n=2 Tax=Cacopsylla melanoneura TaxID=428564 RepID=A0A8D8WGE2_9HEMI